MSIITDLTVNNLPERFRRRHASEYLRKRHGVEAAPATLAKLAVTGGGPEYDLFGRIPYYPVDKLDEWVAARLSRRRSTSDRGVSDGQKTRLPPSPLGQERRPSRIRALPDAQQTAGSSRAHDEGQSGGPDQDGDPASTPAGSIHSP